MMGLPLTVTNAQLIEQFIETLGPLTAVSGLERFKEDFGVEEEPEDHADTDGAQDADGAENASDSDEDGADNTEDGTRLGGESTTAFHVDTADGQFRYTCFRCSHRARSKKGRN